MKRSILLLISAISLFSCAKSTEEIVASYEWKVCGDYPVLGDWISGKKMRISGDTIYFKQPVATILDVTYRYDHYQLEVISLSNGKRGVYCEKGKVD